VVVEVAVQRHALGRHRRLREQIALPGLHAHRRTTAEQRHHPQHQRGSRTPQLQSIEGLHAHPVCRVMRRTGCSAGPMKPT
jgi:hypothetical protein